MTDVNEQTVVQDGGLAFRFLGDANRISVDITALDASIRTIAFTVAGTLPLSHLLSVYGQPSFVCIASWWSDYRWLSIDLVNPTAGVVIRSHRDRFPPQADIATIEPHDPVDSVILFDPPEYQELLHESQLLQGPPENSERCLVPWNGVGDYPVIEAIQ